MRECAPVQQAAIRESAPATQVDNTELQIIRKAREERGAGQGAGKGEEEQTASWDARPVGSRGSQSALYAFCDRW